MTFERKKRKKRVQVRWRAVSTTEDRIDKNKKITLM